MATAACPSSAPPRPRRSRTHVHPAAGARVGERRLAKFRKNVARFRLYRHRFLQVNTRFSAFFEIYKSITLILLNVATFGRSCQLCKLL